MISRMTRTAARLAAQFSRSGGAALTIEEIAIDAERFAAGALAVRRAIERQQNPTRPLSKLEPIANRYQAEIINQGDVNGMVLGLHFKDGTHASGFRNIFFVS